MSQKNHLHLVFGIFGSITSLFLFLAPMATFKRIIHARTTEQFSSIPYLMTLLNCLLGTWYGLPFITKDNYLLVGTNGLGVVIESMYVLIFMLYAPTNREKCDIMTIFFVILAIFSIIAMVTGVRLHDYQETRQLVCGIAVAIFCIVMYASPLSIMWTVIQTKSVEYMPFLLSLFVFLNGTTWLIYGIIAHDIFIYLPNGLGCLLGIMQLVLYAIYRNTTGVLTLAMEDSGEARPVHNPESVL